MKESGKFMNANSVASVLIMEEISVNVKDSIQEIRLMNASSVASVSTT